MIAPHCPPLEQQHPKFLQPHCPESDGSNIYRLHKEIIQEFNKLRDSDIQLNCTRWYNFCVELLPFCLLDNGLELDLWTLFEENPRRSLKRWYAAGVESKEIFERFPMETAAHLKRTAIGFFSVGGERQSQSQLQSAGRFSYITENRHCPRGTLSFTWIWGYARCSSSRSASLDFGHRRRRSIARLDDLYER